jgi:hypothetical protein
MSDTAQTTPEVSSAAAAAVTAPAAEPVAAAASTPAAAPVATPAPAARPATADKAPEPAKDAEKPAEVASLLKAPEKSDAQKGEADKAAEEKSVKADVEIAIPEGLKVNDEVLSEFKAIAKEAGLDSKNAQKFFDLEMKAAQAREAEQARAFSQWKQDSIASLKKEWAGAFEQNVAHAQRAIDRFAPPGLLEALGGLENHPAAMQFFAAIGKAFGEDSLASVANAKSAPAVDHQRGITGNALVDNLAGSLYPSMNKQSD